MAVHVLRIPAETNLRGLEANEKQALDGLLDIWRRYVKITASNRLGLSHYSRNPIFAAPENYSSGWTISDDAIEIGIDDREGSLVLSAIATLHWWKVGWACVANHFPNFTVSAMNPLGVRVPHLDAKAVVNEKLDVPLAIVKRKLVGVRCGSGPAQFIVDDGDVAPDWNKLSAKAQAEVSEVQNTGKCGCKLCNYYRPRVVKW